ncbi:type IX secretion system protein PorQ [Polaribacter sp. Z014]|uniref:type IX secretion system protein PorQ n=1 Tax=Polaribacter sp. Z014 TaxID=2927126 RepID=UPI002021D811|nr:type IX secretion system protein PorQ [Polaribacter sp. Z014]MCL7763155.1 type IX secretion system protein PorQ [Polaribacter sp. Z014]
MNYKNIVFSIFIFSICSMRGQVGGEKVYQFLNVSTSARQVALGGEVLTLLDDVNQPIWNPSVISVEIDNKLSANYTSFLAGINIGSLAYAKTISRRFGTIHGSIKYIDYGSLIGADEEGNETGDFNASDIAVSVGYALNIPGSNFFVGSNIRFINSNIANFSSIGVATDLAILYYSPYKPFTFTLVARNIGVQLQTYNGVNEKLPFKVALGGSYKLEHVPLKWYATIDNLQKWDISVPNPSDQTTDLEGNITNDKVGFIGNAFRHFVIGGELFPESFINLRLGYNFRRAAELKLQNARTFSGFSYGFGIQMNRLKFNYAYSKYHSAANASTFSLLIDLDSRR